MMRILAIVPGGIRDQILFFPTLESLKKKYPKATIDVIVEPRSKNSYTICPYVQDVLVFDFQDQNGLADYLNLLGMIKDREYELAITLEDDWIISFLLWLDGIPTRIGYKSNTSWFLNCTVPKKTEQYLPYMYHELLKPLHINTPCPPLSIHIPQDEINWATAEKSRLNLQDNDYILIHGGASVVTTSQGINKIYPVPKWQRIIDEIQRIQEMPIVLLCGPDDVDWTKELITLCPQVKVVAPPSMGKLAAIIGGARLMVCTDSAPMQLAIAQKVPTIGLFGPTQASQLIPPECDYAVGIQSFSRDITDIVPDQILEKVRQFLAHQEAVKG